MPRGKYHFEDALDSDGITDRPVKVAVTVTIHGDRATIDFTGSDPQTEGSVNANYAVAVSATTYVFRCLVREEIPYTAGVMRPLEVIAPSGSVVSANPPSAMAAGNVETSQRITDVVLGALFKAAPALIPAASSGTMNNITFGGNDPVRRQPFAYYETIAGGMGASAVSDGPSATHTHMTNSWNTPVEAFEHQYPLRIRGYRIRSGSGGRGRHRGGDGIIREYEFLDPRTGDYPFRSAIAGSIWSAWRQTRRARQESAVSREATSPRFRARRDSRWNPATFCASNPLAEAATASRVDVLPVTPGATQRVTRVAMSQTWRRLTFLHWPYQPALGPAAPAARPAARLRSTVRHGLVWSRSRFTTYARSLIFPKQTFALMSLARMAAAQSGSSRSTPPVWLLCWEHASHIICHTFGRRCAWLPKTEPFTIRAAASGRIQPAVMSDIMVKPGHRFAGEELGDRDHFLTARYRLYTLIRGRLSYAQIEHEPWPLARATLVTLNQNLIEAAGLPAPAGQPLVHYAAEIDVKIGYAGVA